MAVTERQQRAYVAGQAAESRVNLEIETEGMTLNIGPQHPATHGTLRVVVQLDGEQVVSAEPIIGYMHRGYAKLTEVRTYPQVTTLVNRIDWLGHFANEVPFILAAEELMEVEAPPRAQWLRTIFFEMARIANITLFLGDMGVQLGALTPVFYAFRDREHVLNLMEAVTGGRFHPNYDRIGGLKEDVPKGWVAEATGAMDRIRTFCDQLLDGLPSGPIMAKVPLIIKVPAGEAWCSTENPLGEMGYYIDSKGDLGPFRCKIRSASFSNTSVLPWVLRGVYVPDVITILAS